MAKRDLTDDNRRILDRLVGKLVDSLHGAVDSWTTMCIEEHQVSRRAFVLKQTEVMKALVVVARSFLVESGLAHDSSVTETLNLICVDCHKLENAFLIMADCRIVSSEMLHSATTTFARVYEDLPKAVRKLGDLVGLSMPFWSTWTPEREAHSQRIIDGLFHQIHDALASEHIGASAASSRH